MWLFTAFVAVAVLGHSDFGSVEALRSFISQHRLAEHHVGVGFDMVRGTVSSARLFAAPAFDLDPLAARARYDVRRLVSARDVHEAGAREMHADYLRGMLTRATPPRFVPPQEGGASCFLASRSDVLLVVKLRAASLASLDPTFSRAVAELPSFFDAASPGPWTDFFSVYPTHFSETALVGGKLVVSVSAPPETGSDAVKTALDVFLHGGAAVDPKVAETLVDRISVVGGVAELMEGSVRTTSPQKVALWAGSIKHSPSVVGHHVRPISDLLSHEPQKRAAMDAAIAAHLGAAYKVWLAEVVTHDMLVRTATEVKQALDGQVQMLEEKRREVHARLLQEQEAVKACENEGKKMALQLQRCRDETKAFTQALIACDARNTNNEHAGDALYACQAKKKLLGC